MVDVFDRHEVRFDPRLTGCSRFVRYSDYATLEKSLVEIEELLCAGQGDDDGMQIMPDFEPGMSTAAKVEDCLHLLEKRRDTMEAQNARLAALEATPPAPKDSEPTRVYEPYHGAFDGILGSDTPPAPKVTEAMAEAASREYMRIFGKHLLSKHARLILTAAQEAGR